MAITGDAYGKTHKVKDGFVGAKFGFARHDATLEGIKAGTQDARHAAEWRNMRPICPYGCGEEGSLLEVIVKDGKALGIYTHSADVKLFTADLQMSPKPTGRKIVIGADGEPHLVEEV